MSVLRSGRHSGATEPRRPPLVAVLAVVAPLATLGALYGSPNQPLAPEGGPVPPTEQPLTSLQTICPGPLAKDASGTLQISSVRPDASGAVSLRTEQKGSRNVDVAGDRVTSVDDMDEPVVVDARGRVAPGVVAGRLAVQSGAGAACVVPRPEWWFTGVGAGADHDSILQLVNPDSGPAVVDIEVLGPDGPVEVQDLRGMTVPGESVERIDLADEVPTRDDLGLHVTVVRGRVGVTAKDVFTEPEQWADWLPGQDEPRTANVLLGVASEDGTLVVSNPGDDEASVDLRVIGSGSTFTPTGAGTISVPPGGTVARDVGDLLKHSLEKGDVGLLVSGNVPVTATLRQTGEEFTHVVGGTAVAEAGSVVPQGKAKLYLSAAEAAGSADVRAYDARGKRLLFNHPGVQRGTAVAIDLPEKTAFVRVDASEEAPLVATVRVSGPTGVITLPLSEAATTQLVPDVQPR